MQQGIKILSKDDKEREEVSSADIKKMHGMWGTLQLFIEKYHPGQIISNRVANLTNNNIMPHFQKFFIKERYKSLRIVFLHRKKQ